MCYMYLHSDMTLVIWDIEADDTVLYKHDHHTEFVVGLDFNLFIEGQVTHILYVYILTHSLLSLSLRLLPVDGMRRCVYGSLVLIL